MNNIWLLVHWKYTLQFWNKRGGRAFFSFLGPFYGVYVIKYEFFFAKKPNRRNLFSYSTEPSEKISNAFSISSPMNACHFRKECVTSISIKSIMANYTSRRTIRLKYFSVYQHKHGKRVSRTIRQTYGSSRLVRLIDALNEHI